MTNQKDKFIRIFKKGIELNGVKESELSILIINKYKVFIKYFLKKNPNVVEYVQDIWARQAMKALLHNPNTQPPGATAEYN